jgi:hypothetical protein
MTSEGSAPRRFTRAIKQGNLFAAELAARELRGLNLHEALDLVALIARTVPTAWSRPRSAGTAGSRSRRRA